MLKLKKLQNSTFTYLSFVFITITPLIFASIWQKQREEDFVFVFFNSCLLFFPLLFLNSKKIYLFIIYLILFIPGLLDVGHIFLYQGRITGSIFFVLFDSNPQETFEYLNSNFDLGLFLSVLIYSVLSFWACLKVLAFKEINIEYSKSKFFWLWIVIPFIGKFLLSDLNIDKTIEAYSRSSHFYSIFIKYYNYQNEIKAMNSFETGLNKSFSISKRSNYPKEQTHILIIGESTTRNNMSIYGYDRETTPELKKLSKELYIFNDVVSSACGTLGNLKRILTLANAENGSTEKLKSNIISIFNNADFKTFWVSNQYILGQHDSITSVFAKQAAISTFLNTTNATTHDEKIIPILKKYLENPAKKKFIVVHMFGTHMKYKDRYPSKFDKFVDSGDISTRPFKSEKALNYINQYDNAILYHDSILAEIISTVRDHEKFMTITYLSDHGEEVYSSRNFHGHPSSSMTKNMYQIPFIMWVSNKYKEVTNINLNNFIDRKYVSDDLEHTLFDLIGIYPDEFEPKKSVINTNFVEKKRFADSLKI